MEKFNPLIIGITGPFGSGKSTAAAQFVGKGYVKITLSSFLEEDLEKRGIKITRKNLQDLGNEWREKYGNFVLAKKALEKVLEEKLERVVIDGVRNVGEIEYFRRYSGFILLGIVCDRKIRFERVKDLKNREKMDYELFEKLDYRDLGIKETEENGLQVAKCLAISDHFIDSNEGFDRFYKDLDGFIKKI